VSLKRLQPGDPIPRFQLKGINNTILTLDLPDVDGPRLLFFFKREQKDSRAAFPMLERLTRNISQTAGRVWALTPDSHGESLETADQFQLSFLILLDAGGKVAETCGLAELPALVHVDKELNVKAVVQGWGNETWKTACLEFAQSLDLDSETLFQEEDWLPGA
jgi:peroxiredoxin